MEKTQEIAREVCGMCETMTPPQGLLAHEVLESITGKWPMWVLYVLAISGEPVRYNFIHGKVKGISHKMLVQTLHTLQRNGLVIKQKNSHQVPPKSEYQLTPLGRELLQATTPLWKWVVSCIKLFEQARIDFGNPNKV